MTYQPKQLTNRVLSDPSTVTYPNNSNADLTCDEQGRLYVNGTFTPGPPAPPAPGPTGWGEFNGGSGGGPIHIVDAMLLLTLNGFLFDTAAIPGYIQFFDASPNLGDTPVNSFRVQPGGNFSWTPYFPRSSASFWVGVSQDPNLFSNEPADGFWIHVEYFIP
jgi:hypothetical protein